MSTTTPSGVGWGLQRRVNRAIALVLVLMLLLAVVITGALFRAKDHGDNVIERWNPAQLERQRAIAALLSQETALRGFAFTGDEAFLEPYGTAQDSVDDIFAFLERTMDGEPDLERELAVFLGAVEAWHTEVADPIIERTRAGDATAQRDVVSREAKAAFDEVRASAIGLRDQLEVRTDEAETRRERAFTWVWVTTGLGLVVLMLTGFVLARGLRRSVLGPIQDLVAQTRRVAGGDLDLAIAPAGPAEIQQLGRDVDLMRASLARELQRVERARVRLERRSAELTRSNDDLEQFAYVASHDLSEPLRKVTNFCQLLERQYAAELDDRAREYIHYVVDGAKRMQVLINDLLAFSRVGRTTDYFEQVDLGVKLEQAMASLDDALSEAGAEVVVRGSLPTVPGDRTLLVALLQNLVGNAVKYRSPDRPPRVEVSAEAQGDSWLITVDDNGIGIDQQYAERVFTIFQRLHVRDAYGGTGIGLALCRKIVEFHGGRIWLQEKSSPGARFQFTLPQRQSPQDLEDDL